MVGADLRHWSSQNSQPRCAAEIPVPKPNFFASEATLPSATYNYTPVGVDVQHAVNAAFQSYGLSNNDMFPASHATQQAREYINQSSDTANPNAVHTLLSKDALQDLLRSIEAMNLPHLSPQAPSVPSEQLRKTLVPMLLKNVQRRPDFNHNLLAEVEVGLRDALTDQFCDSLFRKLVTTRINNREVRATRGSKDGVHGTATVSNRFPSSATVAHPDNQNMKTSFPTASSSVCEIPRAPRAMRSESSTESTSQGPSVSLPKSRRRDTYDFGRLSRQPSEREPLGSALSSRERSFDWDRPRQNHESNRIPIPLDSSFFTTQSASTSHVKRESPGPSTDESTFISRSYRSRSPHRRSLSTSPRHSRHDTTDRRFPHLEISIPNPHHAQSPPRRSRDFRRSRSTSQSRKAHSPSPKRRRHTFSRHRSRSPGFDRSRSRPRKNSFSHRPQSPPAHVGPSRSPHALKSSFHDRDGSLRHRSPEPAFRRRTPVHLRSIDRTRSLPSPHRQDAVPDRPDLSIPTRPVSRSTKPLSAVDNLSARHPSPSRRKHSRSPDSVNYKHRLFSSSPTRTRSRSPVGVSLRHRLARTPDENHPGPLMPGKYMQGLPHINAPEHSDKRDDFVSTSVPNNERATPLAVQGPMVTVKREPDIEDFTIALHPPPLTHPSPAIVPSPCAPGSPSSVFTPPTPLTQVPVAPTHVPLPPTRVSPGPRSMIDINPTIQVLGHPHIPEEDRNTGPSFVELGVDIPPSPVSSSSALPPASEVLSVKLSPQQQQPVISSVSISSKPPSSPSMMTQRLYVPGLWFAKHGQDQADILDCEFEVNSEIVQKWHLPGSSTPEATSERLSLQLLCIPVELLQKTCQIDSIHEFVDLGALTGSMSSMKTVWPEQGSLLVQMNPTKPHKRSWFPEDMGPTSPSLDITDSVHEGKNVLRLIQLEDMTNKIFVLQALLLPPTSQQDTPTYWDIADSNLADHLATGDLSPEIVESI